ncbi:uncharacterized protein PSFLO_03038 [Pseudozyma flocculosa]|uniref:Uncharacterized protein n=1 Tax=Pseudozyma flocculosa TaxID=84751 RepID=A0A5C3EZ61_9BASI|nr:uncharacterized protein PSFLO_03038 [Pseudozyma flocculosa]
MQAAHGRAGQATTIPDRLPSSHAHRASRPSDLLGLALFVSTQDERGASTMTGRTGPPSPRRRLGSGVASFVVRYPSSAILGPETGSVETEARIRSSVGSPSLRVRSGATVVDCRPFRAAPSDAATREAHKGGRRLPFHPAVHWAESSARAFGEGSRGCWLSSARCGLQRFERAVGQLDHCRQTRVRGPDSRPQDEDEERACQTVPQQAAEHDPGQNGSALSVSG